jgi:ribonuclease HII
MMVQKPNLREEMALYAEGYRHIAGLDEAGRGSWAGPVVAGAVILPIVRPDLSQESVLSEACPEPCRRACPEPCRRIEGLEGVRDSKQLTPRQRKRQYGIIKSAALAMGVGIVPPEKIDEIGIVPATRQAMGLAIAQLVPPPDFLLVDYLSLPELSTSHQKSITRGDALSLSIAAASIVAKVTRDRLMVEWGARYPGYGFARHKGYGTPQHSESLARLGPSPIHRLSFAPMRLMLNF